MKRNKGTLKLAIVATAYLIICIVSCVAQCVPNWAIVIVFSAWITLQYWLDWMRGD